MDNQNSQKAIYETVLIVVSFIVIVIIVNSIRKLLISEKLW